MTSTSIIAGIGAGIAATLLIASMLTRSAIAAPLFLLTPLPIAIAGFAWGRFSAAIAAATFGIAVAIAADVTTGISAFLVLAVPMVALVHYFNLWRPVGDSGEREWYPLSEAFLRVAAYVAIALLIAGTLIGYDGATLVASVTADLDTWTSASGLSREQLVGLINLTFELLPLTAGAATVVMLIGTATLASRIAEVSGVPRRPRPPLWLISLPRPAPVVFLVAAILAFLPGTTGDAAAAVAGSFGAALALAGLGVIHAATFARPGRQLLLVLLYVSIPLFGIPIVVLAAIGVVDSFTRLRPPLPVLPPTSR